MDGEGVTRVEAHTSQAASLSERSSDPSPRLISSGSNVEAETYWCRFTAEQQNSTCTRETQVSYV